MIRRDTIFEFSAYFQLLSGCRALEVSDFVHVTFFLALVVANLAQKILFYQNLDCYKFFQHLNRSVNRISKLSDIWTWKRIQMEDTSQGEF